MMKKSGQSSIEFLFVTGIGLLLIVAVAFAFLHATRGSEDKVRLQQAGVISASILQQANTVYSLGRNSWVTMDIVVPEEVVAIYTVENSSLVFEVTTSRGIVAQPVFSSTPITGVRPVGVVSYINDPSTVIHDGPTQLRITSLGSTVEIKAVS
jgi:hypothetical protein